MSRRRILDNSIKSPLRRHLWQEQSCVGTTSYNQPISSDLDDLRQPLGSVRYFSGRVGPLPLPLFLKLLFANFWKAWVAREASMAESTTAFPRGRIAWDSHVYSSQSTIFMQRHKISRFSLKTGRLSQARSSLYFQCIFTALSQMNCTYSLINVSICQLMR